LPAIVALLGRKPSGFAWIVRLMELASASTPALSRFSGELFVEFAKDWSQVGKVVEKVGKVVEKVDMHQDTSVVVAQASLPQACFVFKIISPNADDFHAILQAC
jgi:hypothetical protein